MAASAAEVIDNEIRCVKSDCDRDCAKCSLVLPENTIISALSIATSVLRQVAAGELREVVHEKWTIKQDMEDREGLFIRIVCSNCGLLTGEKSFYCPNCGALMDGRDGRDGSDGQTE